MNKLPYGIQDFVRLRKENYVYVDKTKQIYNLITGPAKAIFLSRPRRFGKSLLCSTLEALFKGKKELFKGLYIEKTEWEWKNYPVLHIDLNPGNYTKDIKELNITINTALKLCAEKYRVTFKGESISDSLIWLLNSLNKKYNQKVAVFIDEYDKPLLSTIDAPETHDQMRAALKSFYSVLKTASGSIEYIFITGVTKFSQASIFSDLNQLYDISLKPDYCDICGITQSELELYFGAELKKCAANQNTDYHLYMERLKNVYNGYRFSRKPLTVYNTFGLFNHFLDDGNFQPYWFQTATPSFLIKLIENEKINILNIENKKLFPADFGDYKSTNLKAIPVLYQSGYLTIVDYDPTTGLYTLSYPNDEVKTCFAEALTDIMMGINVEIRSSLVNSLFKCLSSGDTDGFINTLIPYYANIPYDLITKIEYCYQLIFYSALQMLGLNCKAEVHTSTGSIDALINIGQYIYLIEFKLDKTAEEALEQIETNNYALPYLNSPHKIIKLGINFDSKERNISEWKTADNT
jgi:hypothetical protein